MFIPLSWLREYTDLPAASQEVADRLAMLGFPVAHIVKRPHITNVVVGRIRAIERHPNADRLQVCTIDAGDGAQLTIVTAATNVAAGQIVPVAKLGAKLPQTTIERRTMRGIASEGMLCSPDELALPPEWFEADGIMQLDDSLPLGGDAVTLLGLADDVLDVEITSNRVDAMCAIGLARELAASYQLPLRLPSFENPGGEVSLRARVEIESDDCLRFVAQRFENVRVGTGPARVRVRLALCGIRPINSVVDVSNYVLLETGEPLHVYDAAQVRGGTLIVRDARQGERLVTLDGAERTLGPSALVIADAEGPLGLAGVMGGERSEVNDATSSILLEAAIFAGARVRRTAQLFSLRTEASMRHEKSLAPALAEIGAARAAHMLLALGAHAGVPQVAGSARVQHQAIALMTGEVERLLGLRVSAQRITDDLVALGCTIAQRPEELSVTPPPWRNDLANDADLVEEVARMEGYDAIEAAMPPIAAPEISSREYDVERDAAFTMRALGYHEVITHSLQASAGPHAVALRNPLSDEQRFLRTDLAPALFARLARIGRPYRLFEIGHVFSREEGIVIEVPLLAFAFTTEPNDEPPWRDREFLRCKGDARELLCALTGRCPVVQRAERPGFHPGKCAVVLVDSVEAGAVGRADPRVERASGSSLPLYLAAVRLDRLPERALPHYRPASRYPSTYRDLALLVGAEVSAQSVEAATAQAIGDICTAVRVFDEYRGPQVQPGAKSLALRATMQRFDGTITDEEADAAVTRAVDALQKQLGATIRT